MHLTLKFKPNFSHKQVKIAKELIWHCSKFYNIANYQIKNNDEVKATYTKLDKQFKSNWHCDNLHSHNRQQLLKQLAKDWKSYFNSIKDYNKNPNKYQGKPKPPNFKYLDSNPSQVIFTNLATRIKEGNLLLSLSKEIKAKYNVDSLEFELPTAIQSIIDLDNLGQVRLKQDNLTGELQLLLIYKVEAKAKRESNNIMSIDLGLDNLATLTYKDNAKSHIINGKTVKSKNRYYNNRIGKLSSIRMKQVGSKHFKNTKQITKLRTKRRNYVLDYLHKASKKIIDFAKKYDVSTIVIGDLEGIKQNLSNNKHFVAIPIQRFKKMIEYKAKLEGIKVIILNESYTSGCSALDKEKLNKANYDKSRRRTRGLFVSNEGIKINADVNGSLNIMRKYLKDGSPKLVKQARDIGQVDSPRRIRVS